MRIPYTINKNTVNAFLCVNEKRKAKNRLVSDDFEEWDKNTPKALRELCLQTIADNWEKNPLLEEIVLPADRCYLVELLHTNLPLEKTVLKVEDDAYWKRCYEERWPKRPPIIKPEEQFDFVPFKLSSSTSSSSRNSSVDNKNDSFSSLDKKLSWKQCYLEMHLKEILENLEPENYDPEEMKELADLCGKYVRKVHLVQLKAPEIPSDHIPLSAILTSLPNLQEVSLCFKQTYIGEKFSWHIFDITLSDIKSLSRGLEKCNLTILRIQNSEIDCTKALIILKSLMQNVTLKILDFAHCKISNRGALGFSKLLMEHPALETLILTNNKIGVKGVEAISYALNRPNCRLKSLDLRLNYIDLEGGKSIMRALSKNAKSIQNLQLSACRMKRNPLIAPMLAVNKTLQNLDISNNKIGEEVGKSVNEALKQNFTLKKFDVRMCDLSPEVEYEINAKIEKNRKLRKAPLIKFVAQETLDEDQENAALASEIDNAFSTASNV